MHIALLTSKITKKLVRKTQITLLIIEKFTVPEKYIHFANIFLKKLAKVPSKRMKINKNTIKFKNSK